ncbi:MAG: AMP-binding protein [Candidatus Binatia bacterium]
MAQPTRLTSSLIEEYLDKGYWTKTTLLDALAKHARCYPDREAVVDSRRRLTWRQVEEETDRQALALLDMGLPRDAVVVVQLPNWVEEFLLRFSLKKAGLLGAFVPVVWRQTEMSSVLQQLKPVAWVIPETFHGFDFVVMSQGLQREYPRLRVAVVGERAARGTILFSEWCAASFASGDRQRLEQVRYGPFEVTMITVSSGSTGAPKLSEVPEQGQLLDGQGIAQRLGIVTEDVVGVFAPLSGGPGTMTWYTGVFAGAKMVLADDFSGERLLSLIEKEQIRFVGTAPAIAMRLVECPSLQRYDVSSLRVMRTGAAHLPPSVAEMAERRLGCVIAAAAGTVETGTFAQAGVDDPPEIRLGGSVGRSLPGVELQVVDEQGQPLPPGAMGELWIRGPATGSGYFRNVDATLLAWGELGANGWFRSGDLACIDGQGYVTLVGRKTDMINRGGQKVYPAEIEALLARHPQILEAVVIGLPHPGLGETPCVCIVPKEDHALTLEEVVDFLRHRKIAAYKLPTEMVVVEDFPRGQTIRVNRRLLAQRVLAERLAKEEGNATSDAAG